MRSNMISQNYTASSFETHQRALENVGNTLNMKTHQRGCGFMLSVHWRAWVGRVRSVHQENAQSLK